MARTQLNIGEQGASGTIVRADVNTTTAGSALITKVISGTGVSISNTGTDAGTGDVTVNVSLNPVGVTSETASYTLALTDAPVVSQSQSVIQVSNASAVTITIPTHASVAFVVGTMITLVQMGVGQITVAVASGVTIVSSSSFTTRARYSALTLLNLATDSWLLTGDMT